jgi:hypothetical protein
MKSRTLACSGLAAFLLLLGAQLFGQSSTQVLNPFNPPAFQKYAAPVSSRIAFLASEQGKQFLLHAPNPIAKKLLQRYHGAAVAAEWDTIPHKYLTQGASSPSTGTQGNGNLLTSSTALLTPVSRCAATRFNLESPTNALPQNEESIDFKLAGATGGGDMAGELANDFRGFFLSPVVWSPSVTGYYFEDASGCTPQFEGGTPPIDDPLSSGNQLIGAGDPIINFDPNHDAWFVSSIYESSFDAGVGVFRNTTTNLKSVNCPNGTHNLDSATTCWEPGVAGVNAIVADEQTFFFPDKPDSWVDSRTIGTGAGDVYITDTLFGFGSVIDLIACTNGLTSCSAPEIISGGDTGTQFSDIKTKANGTITITYGNYFTIFTLSGSLIFTVDIKYVSCTPNGAPIAPTCSAPVLVRRDRRTIVDGITELIQVRNNTYPTHVEAAGGSYVFWEHCGANSDLPFGFNFVCPDADIVGSVNTGTGWSAPFAVDTALGHQIQPWATYDSSADKIVIVYQDCDSPSTNQRQACRAGYKTITPTTGGSTTVGLFNALSTYQYPQAEANGGFFGPLFGDYIGASAHQGHFWAGFTDTSRVGTYGFGTRSVNESNNNDVAVDNP